jgi:hypothetical protein
MTIDNLNAIMKDRKLMYISTILLITVLCFVLFTDFFDEPVLGIARVYYVILAFLIYIGFYTLRFLKNPSYISFNDEGSKIIIKYFSLRPFMQQKKTIEIPKDSFVKFETIKNPGGLSESVILYQKINKNIAKYPPISLAAFKKEEQEKLLKALEDLQRK